MTLDTHDKLYELRSQGWSSLQDEALWSTTLLGVPRKTPEDILKILRDLLGYIRSHDSCNLLLLSSYLLDLTNF